MKLGRKFFGLVLASILGLLTSCGGDGIVRIDPLTILENPSSVTVYQTQPVTFSVRTSSSTTPTFQWKRDGVDIPNATSDSYTIAQAALSDSYATFTVAITHKGTTIVSEPASLVVFSAAPFVEQASTTTIAAIDEDVKFLVTPRGLPPFVYQWRLNGTDISGATSRRYTRTIQAGDTNAEISVAVRNSFGSVDALITTITIEGAPEITTHPTSVDAAPDASATFTVVASSLRPITYQWLRDGNPISGATASSYTVPRVALSDNNARFGVIVTGSGGSTQSAYAVLTVTAP